MDIERAGPQLYTVDRDGSKVTEAILDVVSSHPGGLSKFYIDITIRAPHAQRYEDTDKKPGVAAKGGEFDKLERYGHNVLPLSFEPYGRLGADSIKSLRTLALAGSTFCNSPGGIPAASRYGNWRAELERVLVFETADVVLLSLGHSSGLHALRRKRGERRGEGGRGRGDGGDK